MYRYLLAVAFLVLAIDSSPTLSSRHTRGGNSLIRVDETRHPRQIASSSFNLGLQADAGYPSNEEANSEELPDWYDDDQELIEERIVSSVVPKSRGLRILGVLSNEASSGEERSHRGANDVTVSSTGHESFPEIAKKNPSLNFATNSRDLFNRRFQSQIRSGGGGNGQQSSDHYGHNFRDFKRGGEGPTLSIVGPLEVLRQSKLWENARRRYAANQERIRNNERILADKGKRSVPDFY